MKILSIDDMLEAARESDMPNTEHHVACFEAAATLLAANGICIHAR